MGDQQAYLEGADVLRKIGVNFVGIDFDQTFISRHTGGRWFGSAEELATSAREEFKNLVPVLLDSDIHVAIVTFSGQRNLIEQVLRLSLGDKYASRIIIRARDGSWGNGGSREGKQKYLASAAEEFERLHGIQITRSTTLLIDDDQHNVEIALDRGVRGLWFIPEEPENLLNQIISLPV
mmetsp:Transcript_50486/g.99727  ORF Transcript_50486/g.99727 Transcript_50486/m.99727 type:complete len:179 (-) Transcript_50486:493-1029(-)|eukprot:CAMPEP_0176189264 /NCGR_PEP_ID=MMETSP0121_2-20121125/3342_1 /TAXON_ID=160619 /ORGANISM="Kryptoperidinium foliaceum, Strain CCMP 1326" /LENGTH=178 /DNA_ID=CAMNT_0017527867 /DNA_START=1 /DNA_END=537 /DNA_ORIENTATION=+